jgi:outer membrane protein insertion porin family
VLKVRTVPKVLKVLLVLCGTAASALAQQPPAAAFVDRPIAAVIVAIEGRPTTEPALVDAVQTKVGAPLRMVDVRETITHLYSLGRFDDVRVEAEESPSGGVTLRYILQPIHTVTRVLFRGTLGLSEDALRERMSERFGQTPPVSRADDVAAHLQQLYHEQGHLSAVVKAAPTIIEHDPDRATLVFEATAGPRTTITRTTITGRPLETPAQIQARLNIQPGQPYQPGELRTRLDEFVTAMRRRRHYQATANVQTAAFNPDRTLVDLTVDVQPGPLVTVQFTGDALPKDKIAELVPVEREGSVDQDLLEDSARRITDYLNQQGYWKADVRPPDRREADGQLTILFNVNRGRVYRVAPGGVEVTGNQSIPIETLRPLLRLPQGDLYLASRLSAIEGAIKQLYRTQGFATADVVSAANEVGDGLVKPVIVVKEGPRVVIGEVSVTGNAAIPIERLKTQLSLEAGQPYYGPAVARDRDALFAFYLNEGYASAEVTVVPVTPVTTPDGARANVTFKVAEGAQTIVEHIFITGNLRTNPIVIQQELQIEEGRPLGLAALTESRRRLSALGLFRRIQISAISHGDPGTRDVIIHVEEAQQTTMGYGGGLEIDRRRRLTDDGASTGDLFEFAPRGFFELGRRNLGGRNRSVNLYTRLSLRPNTKPEGQNRNPFGFSEYRIVGTYREPRALGNYGDLTATSAIEQGVRTGFNFSRKGFNAELSRRFAPTIAGSARYSLATTRIRDFDDTLDEADRLTIDRVFPQVRLSAFSAALSRDTRDDLLEPQKGTFLSSDGTLAARGIGSEVGYIKTFLQGFWYRNLGRPNLVFAGGARLGVARGFLRVVNTIDENGVPQAVPVRDLPATERFFVGGDTTIRGYAFDSVGAPDTITARGFPRGGDAEVVLNAELRTPVYGPVGAVVFVDGGNVFARTSDLDLSNLRGSVGFGARYRSPIGPIRVDIGFKLDRRRIGDNLEPRYAIHFSIGQAF